MHVNDLFNEEGGGGFPITPNYKVGDRVTVRNRKGIGKIAYIKHRGDVGVVMPNGERVKTNIDHLRPVKPQVAEALPGSLSKSDYTPGATKKHDNTNCTTCHGRKVMYKTPDGKLHADNKVGAKKVSCPTCKGTGDKVLGEATGSRYAEQLARSVYEENPDLDTSGRADDLISAGFALCKAEMGPQKARNLFAYDEDFADDFVSAYQYLQQGGAEHISEEWGQSNSVEAVANAIRNRILRQHIDLLQQHGLDRVDAAIEDVASNYPDLDEIGSSDVSAFVDQVIQHLGGSKKVNEAPAKVNYTRVGDTEIDPNKFYIFPFHGGVSQAYPTEQAATRAMVKAYGSDDPDVTGCFVGSGAEFLDTLDESYDSPWATRGQGSPWQEGYSAGLKNYKDLSVSHNHYTKGTAEYEEFDAGFEEGVRDSHDHWSESIEEAFGGTPEVGDLISYDAGEGTDRWQIMSIDDSVVYLQNDYGATTTASIDEISAISEGTGLSYKTLASYKKKAGEQMRAADKAKDFAKADKRYSGVIKATKKEFEKDVRKDVEEAFKPVPTHLKSSKPNPNHPAYEKHLADYKAQLAKDREWAAIQRRAHGQAHKDLEGKNLDIIWRKVEDVVSRIFPDGDPIDYLAPWLEKHGIRDFKIGEVLERAAKKHGYKDIYDYWEQLKQDLGDDYGITENTGSEVDTDQLLYFLTDAWRRIVKMKDGDHFTEDGFYTLRTIYELLRDPLLKGDFAGFERTWEYVSGKWVDAFDFFAEEAFESAGLPSDQGTYEQFIAAAGVKDAAQLDESAAQWMSDSDLADMVGEGWIDDLDDLVMDTIGYIDTDARAKKQLLDAGNAWLKRAGYTARVIGVRNRADGSDELDWAISGDILSKMNEISTNLAQKYMGGAIHSTITGKKNRQSGITKAISRLSGTNKPILDPKKYPSVAEDKSVADSELQSTLDYAHGHYPSLDKDTAFKKFVQRSLKHAKETDAEQDAEIARLGDLLKSALAKK